MTKEAYYNVTIVPAGRASTCKKWPTVRQKRPVCMTKEAYTRTFC